jgi:hypothetical protein
MSETNHHEGRSQLADNPVFPANLKTKKLASPLQRWPFDKLRVPRLRHPDGHLLRELFGRRSQRAGPERRVGDGADAASETAGTQ